jgi:hypothetical protein
MNEALKEFTYTELQVEIDRRNKLRALEKLKPKAPPKKQTFNFDVLRHEIDHFVVWLGTTKECSKIKYNFFMQNIATEAINAVYGPKIWEHFIIPMQKWHEKNKQEK